MDKLKIQQKLIIDSRNGIYKRCYICGNDITRNDINRLNFDVINKNYIHTTCIHKHVPVID